MAMCLYARFNIMSLTFSIAKITISKNNYYFYQNSTTLSNSPLILVIK